MKTLIVLFLLVIGSSCKRPLGADDIPGRLKNTMTEFLKKSLKEDSSSIKFDVQDVSYFEDKDFYECEFKVRMTDKNTDTIGIMRARVARDFSTITRKW